MNSYKLQQLAKVHQFLGCSVGAVFAGIAISGGWNHINDILTSSAACTVLGMAIANHVVLERHQLTDEQKKEDITALQKRHGGTLGVGLLVGLTVAAGLSALKYDTSSMAYAFFTASHLFAITTQYASLEAYEQQRAYDFNDGMKY